MVEQRAVAVRRALQLLQVLREDLRVIDVDLRQQLYARRQVFVVSRRRPSADLRRGLCVRLGDAVDVGGVDILVGVLDGDLGALRRPTRAPVMATSA